MSTDSEDRSSPASPPGPASANPPGAGDSGRPPPTSRVWLWIVAAFALQLAVWVTWFVIASHHRVAEVPLETAVGDKR